jgi:hypothetical protein
MAAGLPPTMAHVQCERSRVPMPRKAGTLPRPPRAPALLVGQLPAPSPSPAKVRVAAPAGSGGAPWPGPLAMPLPAAREWHGQRPARGRAGLPVVMWPPLAPQPPTRSQVFVWHRDLEALARAPVVRLALIAADANLPAGQRGTGPKCGEFRSPRERPEWPMRLSRGRPPGTDRPPLLNCRKLPSLGADVAL